MKKVRAILLIIMVFASLLLSGCWDYYEINNLAIVTGLAVDKLSDGTGYNTTVEVVDLRGGGKETKIQSKRIESKGSTIQEAVNNIVKVSAKRLYGSHLVIVIISQDVARQGILPLIDSILRGYQPRLSIHLLISKVKTAKELLSQQSITTDIRSIEMEEMISSENQTLSKAPRVDVRDFINDLSGVGISATLPTVGIVLNENEKTSELSGTAIFKRDKFVGLLNEEDTKYFLFVKNQVNGAYIPIYNKSRDSSKDATVQVISNKTKVTPVYTNGKLKIIINVNTKIRITELEVSENFMSEKGLDLIKKEIQETIKTNINNVINKVKDEFDSDIFGFGRTIKREMPSVWNNIASDWKDIFKNVPVNVNVKIDILGSGLAAKPIKIGD